jgi:hypothetical protein
MAFTICFGAFSSLETYVNYYCTTKTGDLSMVDNPALVTCIFVVQLQSSGFRSLYLISSDP